MIDGRNIFDQPIKNDMITYENIQKITTVQGDDYTAGCLLDYPYFKIYYNMMAIDLSKQTRLSRRKCRSSRKYTIFFHY